ncbi:GbsR/MarR family transcriptional regulator [Ornithinibacillus bavariensis]|uniref:GbsR/MarR family transcriptional regulator n=1 Tax=Ornithinibacillus bavariensis TaxID=545502 RepID=UPI003D1AD52A
MLTNNSETIRNGILMEFAKTVELFDLSPIEARVFTYLYIEGKALTLDDLSEALGKSKTSMSTSVRSLVNLNLVKRVWRKGVRKDLFQANIQLFKHLMNLYLKKWNDATSDRTDALLDFKKQFELLSNEEKDENISKKLDELLEFHQMLEDFFQEALHMKR